MSFEMFNAQELKQELFQHESISIYSCGTYSEWPPGMLVNPSMHGAVRLDAQMALSDDPKHDPAHVLQHMDRMVQLFDIQRHQDGRAPLDWLSVMTDGGPGHYKQRFNFWNCTQMPWRYKRSEDIPLVLDWSFFGEHHGKCILDAFTAILKSSWRTHIDSHHVLQGTSHGPEYHNDSRRQISDQVFKRKDILSCKRESPCA